MDGHSVGTSPYSGQWQATGNTLIGHGLYGGSQVDYVNGAIDDVSMYSSALTADQVAALDQPAAYSFDDGAGTTAADVSGHGNTLTLGSGASWAPGHVGSNAILANGTEEQIERLVPPLAQGHELAAFLFRHLGAE